MFNGNGMCILMCGWGFEDGDLMGWDGMGWDL